MTFLFHTIFLVPVWSLIRKTLGIMSPFFYLLSVLFVIWSGYKMLMWGFLWILRKRLEGRSLEDFKKLLGNNYQAKKLEEGDKRYKWDKRIFCVKANFDQEGNMICNIMEPMKFWSLRSELSFN